MKKDFDAWNSTKKQLEDRKKDFLFSEREIWWCSVGLNVATESCGKGETYQRPVLILKKLSRNSFIGIPLSTQEKNGTWFTDVSVHGEKRYVLLYQIRMFSTNRFQRRLATLDDADFNKVKEKLETLLELPNHHQSQSSGSVGNPKSS
jgi:mRNA-degrading endonuclease toxin of MazEF toxin-antitoxin module